MSNSRFLLPLPFELRLQIYLALLRPDEGRHCTLYHQEKGRSINSLSPAILEVSKQTYKEAVEVLYTENIFEINLSLVIGPSGPFARFNSLQARIFPDSTSSVMQTGPAHIPNLKSLLRVDGLAGQDIAPYLGRPLCNLALDGVVFPNCLRRLHHIELVTSYDAFWTPTRDWRPPKPSNMPTMILDVLACLCSEREDSRVKTRKSLKFTMIADKIGNTVLARSNSMGENAKAEDVWTKNIILLLRRLRKTRDVVVLEESQHLLDWEGQVQEIDINTFDVPW